jgi:diaminohydroxyphosphoribosylaminopyrimidine deaminase / 5-amino-6-(5-phosphoribosylamino)uracil reductase
MSSASSEGFTEFDTAAMRRALELAEQGLETTQPNPRVGCVIARRDRIISEGWHERAGEVHAEVMALEGAGSKAGEATAYVTLEPCSHHGRTPPCVNALIEAKIARVVFALADPNPEVNGQGAQALRHAGILVQSGLLEQEARDLNAGFIKRMQQGIPWVRVKSAMSLDARTALADGESQWITNEQSRADVQRWRARSSAVLTGIGSVLADNPRLTVRSRESAEAGVHPPQPLRVVIDSELRTPPDAHLFAVSGEVLILTTANFESAEIRERAAALERSGARIEGMSRSTADNEDSRRADLQAVLARLGELEVNELLIEAGPTLAGEFVRQGLVDELLIYLAPALLGPQGHPLFELPQLLDLRAAQRFELQDTARFGDDLRLRLRPLARR